MQGYGYYRDHGTLWYLAYWLINFIRQMTICIVGVALVFAGDFLCEYEDQQDKLALQTFLQDVATGRYEKLSDITSKVPEGVSVRAFNLVSYDSYEIEATSGDYTFKGAVQYGSYRAPFEYTKTEEFWEKGVVLSFAGECLAIVGLGWVLVKYVLGVRSWEELRIKQIYLGHD